MTTDTLDGIVARISPVGVVYLEDPATGSIYSISSERFAKLAKHRKGLVPGARIQFVTENRFVTAIL